MINIKTGEIIKELNIYPNVEQEREILKWDKWYKGFDKEFHEYTIKRVDGRIASKNKMSLNFAKKMCEDLTKLIWSEEVEIVLDNKDNTEELYRILINKNNDFFNNMSLFIEKTLALGTGAIIEYYKDGELLLDYVTADNITPYKYINNNIYGFVTSTLDYKNGKYYTILPNHEYENKVYKKEIFVFESNTEGILGERINPLKYNENLEIIEKIYTESPRFQIFKTNLANNLNSSPMGISIYANSLNKLKSLDEKYNSLNTEFKLGKKRVTISKNAVKGATSVDENGQPVFVQYFDTDDEVFVVINTGNLDNDPVKEIDMNLRVEEHIKGINNDIRLLSSHIGLGDNFYSLNETSGLKTATEVISEKSEAYRTTKHYQNLLYTVIYDLIKAVCEMAGIEYKEINIKFDDSIVIDKESERNSARLDVQSGLMSKEYYMKNYRNLSEDEVKKEIQQLNDNVIIDDNTEEFIGA